VDPELHAVTYAFDAAFQRMCEATDDDALMAELSNVLHHLFRLRELCRRRMGDTAFFAVDASTADLGESGMLGTQLRHSPALRDRDPEERLPECVHGQVRCSGLESAVIPAEHFRRIRTPSGLCRAPGR
jgi:hypothetical protein